MREENKEWILNNTDNGIITSKAVTEHGIHRSVLSEMVKSGELIQCSRGIYMLADEWEDEFYLLQQKYNASFTAAVGTALTYTFTPNTLYKVDKVIYNGTDVTSELSGSTYTAPALAGNATLSVSFKFIGGGGTDPSSPQTGDNSHLLLWITLLIISSAALTGTAIYGRKKKS